MKTEFLRGFVERAVDGTVGGEAGDPIWFVATTEGRKADGLDLQMDALRLERFMGNPVIGYGHNYWGRDSLPIGRGVDVEVKSPALRIHVAFDQKDAFATTVEQKVRDGYLNAMSVGFDAWDIDENGVPAAWELFESSVVPIPMDPDALAEAGRAAVRDFRGALDELTDRFGVEDPGSSGVRILRLEPDDVLVARAQSGLPDGAADHTKRQLEGTFPGHQVVVLEGIQLDVARKTAPVPGSDPNNLRRRRLQLADRRS